MNQLRSLMGEYVDIECMVISEIKSKPIEADLILFTSAHLKDRAVRRIDANIPNLVAKRVIDHKNIKEIISIKEGTDVLLINDSYESTTEAINQIIELGLDHIIYHPYYPECTLYPKLQTAITIGETQLVPYMPEKLIDIDIRILDIKSIYEIATALGIDKYIKTSVVTDYIRDIIEISRDIDESRRNNYESQQILQMILNNLDYGVGFVNIEGKIISINSKFEYIFGLKKKELLEKRLQDLIICDQILLKDNTTLITKLENKEVTIQIREVNFSKKIGFIINVKVNNLFSDNDSKTNGIRNRYIKRNLLDFDDYLTVNSDALNMIKRAKKFSKSDGTVLIIGENGTGKEILAQSIHMNSYRSNKAFVPINIATFTGNLVDSELFGYEEGTFTGAIKGGKLGIFEIANGGTIFIDEIGDVPMDVQAKLMRVLEGKRIRRIGSADEISVDVRIIAATNKNLLNLIKEDKFRPDLFYRLNILPLETIPLRKRREDIEYLLKYFINVSLTKTKLKNINEFFEEETICFLKNYDWPGNVRELLNLVEYLVLIYEENKIGISSLHSYMRDLSREKGVILDSYEIWVLKQFYKNSSSPLGRTKITEIAESECIEIGEGKIRRIITDLKNMQLIEDDGNKGSRITEAGRDALSKYI